MKKYAIVTDSTTYFSEEDFNKYGIKRASLNVIRGDESFKELEITNEFIHENLNNGVRLSTSQPAPGEFLEIYQELLKEDYDKIFVMVIAETISGTYQSANLATKMLDNNEKIHLFRSDSGATGNEMLLLELIKMINEDKPYDEMVSRIEVLNSNIKLLFTVENLTALMRSGRLSKAKALIGSMLRIKPVVQMENGKLDLYKVGRTSKKVLNIIAEDMTKQIKDYKRLFVRIINHNSSEFIDELVARIKEKFHDVELTVSNYIGPVFNVHLGSKGFGVTWMYE